MASARLFIEEGAKVLVTDIQDGRGWTLANELGSDADYLHADVSIEDDVERAIGHAIETFGCLDVMFNNVSIVGAVGTIARDAGGCLRT